MPDCHPVCRRAQERGFAKMFSFVQAHPAAVIAGAAAALLLLAVLIPLTIASILTLINTQSWTLMIASLVAYGFVGKLACDPLLLALIADHAPKDKMSTVYGLYNCIAMVGAIAAPYVTGWLRDSTGTWDSGFYFAVGLLTIGWTALWTLKSRHAQPTN